MLLDFNLADTTSESANVPPQQRISKDPTLTRLMQTLNQGGSENGELQERNVSPYSQPSVQIMLSNHEDIRACDAFEIVSMQTIAISANI